jgi:hypothetical protein
MLHLQIPAAQLSSNGEADISPAPGSNCSLDLCPVEASGEPWLSGSSIDWVTSFEGRSIHVTVSASGSPRTNGEAIRTLTGVAMRSMSANQPLNIDVSVTGLTGHAVGVSTFTQVQLIRDQHIQYLWTWKTPQTLKRYAARRCFAILYENNEVAIFQVDPNCSD